MTAATGPTPLTYDGYIAALGVLGVTDTAAAAFQTIVPQMLNYAELRIQRDLDLLPLQNTSSTYSLTAGDNVLQVAVNDFVTVQNVQYINGTKAVPLVPVSKEWLQSIYNDSSVTASPSHIAPYGGDATTNGATWSTYLVGPYPDQNYNLLITGTSRMRSLDQYAGGPQSSTGTTFISALLPDLLLMASMVFLSAYQRNFSASSDDPNMAVNYEKSYQTLLKGAMGEEIRKRWRADAWTAEAPSPAATPGRT